MLATKLFAPTRRPQLVARPGLIEQLDTALDANTRLTLLSAPAGFGKTTLVTDWLSHLDRRQPPIRVGWLTLDEGDNDPIRLLSHLVAALRRAGVDADPATFENLEGTAIAGGLTTLVNEISRAAEREPGTQRILVLDDYHAIVASDVHQAVALLLGQLPDRLHALMATRSDPPLPLPRLRSRGQLTEVRAADLRFTPPEAREFLNHVMGLDLGVDAVDALADHTEGWIAGLQLAALSLHGIPEPDGVAAFIEEFTGSNRFVIDYLADEVLARQPVEVRDFLLRTAVLDRLTSDLCDAVTGSDDGGRTLEDLERGNLFLVPLDDHRAWYRDHHLFADVLRARLRAEHPQQVPDLHRRASAWYAAHHLTIDAVGHALAAEDFHRAAYLMEEALPEMRRARQDGLLLSWMRALPESVVRRSPVLSVLSAWSLLMSGDLDAMELRLDDADAALAAGAQDPNFARAWADTDDLRTAPATISVYRAPLAQARGDVAGTVRHARRAVDLAGPHDHFIRGAGGGYLGLALWVSGAVTEALDTFGGAVRSLHAAGNLVDELDATVVLADMWVAAGRPGRARRLFEQALTRATGGGEPSPRAAADLHVGLAELDRELDDLAGAEAHLETARVLARRASITENRHRWYVTMALVRAATGDYDTAADLLDEAESLYRRGFYPDVRPIHALKARLRIAAGDLGSAAAWAHDRGVSVVDDADYLREYEHLTLVRLLLAEHRAGDRSGTPGAASQVAAALGLLGRLRGVATGAGRDGSVLEIMVLRALAHHAHGDAPRAAAALRQAQLEAPEPDSYVRLYLDEGPPMHALLRHVVAAQGHAASEHSASEHSASGQSASGHSASWQARRLLERATAPTAGGGPPPALASPLSPREIAVLGLLDSELTGPEIARRLFVSLNTLRTHTKHIFTKLDVTSRAAAVRRGHDLGLL